MSTDFIDANDLDRLERERTLTKNAPRVLPEGGGTDVEPDEQPEFMNMTVGDLLIESLMNELERRLG